VAEFNIKTTSPLPNAVVGGKYDVPIVAEGGEVDPGTGQYALWEMSGLPTYFTIDSTGLISNTGGAIAPTDVGLKTVIVNVTDYTLPTPLTVSKTFELRITDLDIFDPPDPGAGNIAALPVAVIGKDYYFQATGIGGTQPYAWEKVTAAGDFPGTISINPISGVISGDPGTVEGTFVTIIKLSDYSPTGDPITAFRTISITVANFKITTTELPNAVVGTPYSASLTALGGVINTGTGLYNLWDAVGLPAFLNINPNTGTITNTGAMTANVYPVTITVWDNTQPKNLTTSETFDLRITDLDIDTTGMGQRTLGSSTIYQLPTGAVGSDYDVTLTGLGGSGLYEWSSGIDLIGSLPPGISDINPVTGRIFGTPDVGSEGTYVFEVKLQDLNDPDLSTTKLFEITIGDLVIQNDEELQSASIGRPYSEQLYVLGGTPPYTWSLATGSSLPGAGSMTLDTATGLISATSLATVPTGTYSFRIQVQDSGTPQISTFKDFTIQVTDLYIDTTGMTQSAAGNWQLTSGTLGVDYTFTIPSVGGSGYLKWEIILGSDKPGGLGYCGDNPDFTGASCTFNGIPNVSGTSVFRLQATDAVSGVSVFEDFEFSVSDLEIITESADIPTISIGSPIAAGDITLQATGGTAPLAWTSSNLSAQIPGLTITAGGDIIGTALPTTEKVYTITFSVTDSLGVVVSKDLDIKVTSLYLTGATYPSITIGDGTEWVLSVILNGGPTVPGSYGGGSGGYQWALVGGSVPAGMTFDSATGQVKGVPTGHGFYTWRLSLTDLADLTVIVEDNFGVQIINPGIQGSGGGGSTFCFIATAAYGSYLDGEVISLRRFRDNYLLNSSLGRAAVSFYYRSSPPVADFIARHDTLRFATRLVITPIAYAARFPMPFFGIVFFAGAVALTARTKKKA
jgi:hypothetical protein